MPGIQDFNDFMQMTGPTYIRGADQIINDAAAQNYVFSRLLRGKDVKQRLVQSGSQLRDVIMLAESSTYGHYLPNDTFIWSNPQVTDTITAEWRFSIDHMSWTDQEIELNIPEGISDAARGEIYKRLKRSKEQRLWTSFCGGYESDLWRAPLQAQMEGATGGKLPYSLPTFITERSFVTPFGVRGNLPTQADGSAFTQLMGLVPSIDPRWSNAVEFYSPYFTQGSSGSSGDQTDVAPKIFDVNEASGPHPGANVAGAERYAYPLLQSFDNMFLKLQFLPPETKEQYFEDPNMNAQMILCSREGQRYYRACLRAANDSLMGAGSRQDPAYQSPLYSGIPLRYVSHLDNAALYPAASGGVSNASIAGGANRAAVTLNSLGTEEVLKSSLGVTADKGPRYFWVNAAYLTPIMHARRYMEVHPPQRHRDQPFTWVQPVDSWWNLFANSRNRHGIIAPLCSNK